MRKFFCILLCAMMIAGCAAADGVIPNLRESATVTPDAQTTVFSFRGGVQWNMSRAQVQALEGGQLTERAQEYWSILYPLTPVEVSKFTADLVYMFYNDQLKMISYDFGTGGTESDFLYLTGALDSVYGEHTEPDASAIIGVMDQIYPGYYTAEKLSNCRAWTAGEDTLVYLYYYGTNAYAILYVCVQSTTGGQSGYVTNGL